MVVSSASFSYRFRDAKNAQQQIEERIELPLSEELDYEELAFRLIDKYKIPCREQDEFLSSMKEFVVLESERQANEELGKLQEEFHRDFAQNKSRVLLRLNRLDSIVNGERPDRRKQSVQHQNSADGNLVTNSNFKHFNHQHHQSFVEQRLPTDGGISLEQQNRFRKKYHELIHSGFLTDALVRLEHSFAMTLSSLVLCQEKAIKDLTEKQANQMEEKIRLIGESVNEADINLLSHQHYQATDNLRNQWATKIAQCKEMQKKDFIDWVDHVYEDFRAGHNEKILNSIKCLTDSTNQNLLNRIDQLDSVSLNSTSSNHSGGSTHANPPESPQHQSNHLEEPKMEESFTINLGSQLKSSHNLRLTAIDILDLCRINFSCLESAAQPSPHRIHAAMSLYSNSSALVLIVDNRISSYGNVKSQFSRLCNMSTEFHFNELEQQLDEIRQEARCLERDGASKLTSSNDILLEPGDFYITRHSNLAKVHAVYHLVADESVLSPEINSRHPVILGLRNILKISHLNDINTICIPLLLINELNESITLQWCIKRAELVLKCVKGFMIEISALSPSNEENSNKTIQFLVPTVSGGGASEMFYDDLRMESTFKTG